MTDINIRVTLYELVKIMKYLQDNNFEYVIIGGDDNSMKIYDDFSNGGLDFYFRLEKSRFLRGKYCNFIIQFNNKNDALTFKLSFNSD